MLRARPAPCFLVLVIALCRFVRGEEIAITLDDGHLPTDKEFVGIIINARFTQQWPGPWLSFTVKNQTTSPWDKLELRFDIDAICNGEPRQWLQSMIMALGWAKEFEVQRGYDKLMFPLLVKGDDCNTETILASLVSAENSHVRINNLTGERVDLDAQRRALETEQRIEAEKEAKKAAAEAERRKKIAAERKKRDAEEEARSAKDAAERQSREAREQAREQARLRAACRLIFEKTSDKKVSDLTVREAHDVETCQLLGLYFPRGARQ
jgi:hypothetical protein